MKNFKHGHAQKGKITPAFSAWWSMLKRCKSDLPQNTKLYKNRGITVCKRWFKFENFLLDMGEPPPKTTLDRSNNDFGYYKENCRWATQKQQSRNRRISIYLNIFGDRIHIVDAAEKYGVKYSTIIARIKKQGLSHEEAITRRVDNGKKRIRRISKGV